MKSTIAAIDFGTCKIVTLVAETSGTQRCDIIGAGIAAYDGFLDGEWNNTVMLNEAIQKSITEAETQSKRKIREIKGILSAVQPDLRACTPWKPA